MSHHRDHAIAHLLMASKHLKTGHDGLISWSHRVDFDDPEDIKIVEFQITELADELVKVVAMLKDGVTELDVIRAQLNRPQQSGDAVQLSRIFQAIYSLARASNGLLPLPPGIIRRLVTCWRSLDMALWHINDAIREEVYNDPAFAETP